MEQPPTAIPHTKARPSQNWPKITTYDYVHQIFITSCMWFRRGVLCDRGFKFLTNWCDQYEWFFIWNNLYLQQISNKQIIIILKVISCYIHPFCYGYFHAWNNRTLHNWWQIPINFEGFFITLRCHVYNLDDISSYQSFQLSTRTPVMTAHHEDDVIYEIWIRILMKNVKFFPCDSAPGSIFNYKTSQPSNLHHTDNDWCR